MKRQKGSGIRRPFINKKNRLMLGNGKRTIKRSRLRRPFINKRIKKQKGGFFGPILKMLFKK